MTNINPQSLGTDVKVIAHMVVGPGEADRFLAAALAHANDWADVIHVALDPHATESERYAAISGADYVTRVEGPSFIEHEGKFRTEAWRQMEETCKPLDDDFVVCIDADEVIVDAEAVRRGIKEYPGQRLSVLFHHMWDNRHYRVDGGWKPHLAWIIIPYRPNAHHADRAMACGREPTYANVIPKRSRAISDILHLGYMRDEDKRMKYDRYMELDGGAYHSGGHIQSIIMTPSLEAWSKGGISWLT